MDVDTFLAEHPPLPPPKIAWYTGKSDKWARRRNKSRQYPGGILIIDESVYRKIKKWEAERNVECQE